MKLFVLKRIIMIVPTAILVALLSFSIIYFSPGNSAELILRDKNPTGLPDQETILEYEKKLGLDKSFPQIFSAWILNVAKGDLGHSFKTGLPVIEEFSKRFIYTLKLITLATVLYVVVGVLIGVFSALYQNSFFDSLVRLVAVLNLSIPSFWLALFFLWLFAVHFKLFPPFGYQGFISLVLPSVVLALSRSSTLARLVRSYLLEALNSPYVLTARAIGLSERVILFKHVLKNISLPMITLIGMNSVGLIGGTIIIESIFGFPGVGSYLVSAIQVKDFPVISGFVFLFGMMIVMINLLVDLSYAMIDPRVRFDQHAYKSEA